MLKIEILVASKEVINIINIYCVVRLVASLQ